MNAYLAMAALALAAAVWLARPWLARALPATLRRRRANVDAYRTRLGEIEAECRFGAIDAETAATLCDEAAARLLHEAAAETDRGFGDGRRRFGVALTVALLPIAVAGGWYATNGSWRVQRQIAAGPPTAAEQTAQVRAAVDQIAAHLQQQPGDAQGWALLGVGRMNLDDAAGAAAAFHRANVLSGQTEPDWLVAEGEALALAHGHDLSGAPAALFSKASAIAPDNPRVLWYAGLVALQAGDRASARARWQRLAQQDMPADVRKALEAQIRRIGGTPSLPVSTGSPAPARLEVQVVLAPDLRQAVPDGATLFVFAQAPDGPPMPLAARRLPAHDFPLQVTLDDSNAPMGGRGLASVNRYRITARISTNGQALPGHGDLEGSVIVDRAQAQQPVKVVIDRRLS
ncbi:MAG: c-type cytochrome biogenesis protein CcmI [Gammaproteobacteria bacterium]|nr:c-type cytochrome biogenesis protein CcmI [Gammaproteobacteria bacterium]